MMIRLKGKQNGFRRCLLHSKGQDGNIYFLVVDPSTNKRQKSAHKGDVILYKDPDFVDALEGLEDTRFGTWWFEEQDVEIETPSNNRAAVHFLQSDFKE